jgi:PAS domain S-box-containing protein
MSNTIRVLVIDDDPDDFFITDTYLEEIGDYNFEAVWARNYAEGLEKIVSLKPDICLLDFLLGNKTGINLLREVRDMDLDVPIILLTGKGDRAIDREAMNLGATDYLIKTELNSEVLERSIRYALSHVQALRTAQENGQLYQTIFDKSTNGVYLVNAETLDFEAINDAATQILGYDNPQFLRYLKFSDLFNDPSEADKIVEILRGGNSSINDYEVALKTQKGEVKKCLLSGVNHVNLDNTQQFHGTISDLTHLQEAENDRLLAEKMAATSRFTRALAHEVRNPLTNIDLSVEQLESENEGNEDLLDYLDIIKRNSKRIGTLITELLHNSSPLNLEFSKHNLHCLLDQMLEMAQDRLTLKSIALHKNYASEDPSVLAASESFKIAILNIVVNAIEALPNENGRIAINTMVQGDDCFISIEDNGHGIPEDQLTRIFEPYVTTKQKGTGLGLITTLNIVKAHKGIIRVNSTVGVGTQFLLIIPIYI